MADPVDDILIRPASYWEIAIKIRLGRYTLNVPYELFMQRAIGGTVWLSFPLRRSTQRHCE
jgi:PIN domain nuclease of toxin-antitoxin system